MESNSKLESGAGTLENPNDDYFPEAKGKRIAWEDIPLSVRDAIEKHFRQSVVKALTRSEGFSPGLAAKLTFSDGRVVFAKAVGSAPNAKAPDIHRREIKIASQLPADHHGEFPRLLWTCDDGDWVVLIFENVEGRTPLLPWKEEELLRVLSAITELSNSLTPSPIVDAISVAEQFKDDFNSWRTFEMWNKNPLKVFEPWCERNLDRLKRLEEKWEAASVGDTLVHSDIRADNILLAEKEGKVVFVDWPWACLGAKWLDLVLFLPSVAMQGGPKPWEIFDSHALGKGVDPDLVTPVVAALAGFFIRLGNKPPEPGIPNLREFQLGQGETALEWLKVRTGWP